MAFARCMRFNHNNESTCEPAKCPMKTKTLKSPPFLLANVNSRSPSLYVVVRPSVCRLSSVVCLSSVTFMHPTQAIEIFGNVSTPFGTLAICDPSVKILRRSSQGNPSIGGLNQRGVENVAILDLSKAISPKR